MQTLNLNHVFEEFNKQITIIVSLFSILCDKNKRGMNNDNEAYVIINNCDYASTAKTNMSASEGEFVITDQQTNGDTSVINDIK